MKKVKLLSGILGAIMAASIFSGCTNKETVIPGDIIQKAASAYEKPKSYYGELKIQTFENGKLMDTTDEKIWRDYSSAEKKLRSEMTSSTYGKQIITINKEKSISYVPDRKSAMITDLTKVSNYPKQPIGTTYKNGVMDDIKDISATHEIIFKGEEDVNGFTAYHLYAKANDGSLIGDVDYWIDKENWFMVKTVKQNANYKTVEEYSKLEFSDKFDDSLFTLELPADVKIEDPDNLSYVDVTKIDLNKAVEIAGKPILTMPENSGYQLIQCNYVVFKQDNSKRIAQSYIKDGEDAFVIEIYLPSENNYFNEMVNNDTNLKDITLRGKNAKEIEYATSKFLYWTEDGLGYNLITNHPGLTLEDAIKIAEGLQHTK